MNPKSPRIREVLRRRTCLKNFADSWRVGKRVQITLASYLLGKAFITTCTHGVSKSSRLASTVRMSSSGEPEAKTCMVCQARRLFGEIKLTLGKRSARAVSPKSHQRTPSSCANRARSNRLRNDSLPFSSDPKVNPEVMADAIKLSELAH